MSSETTGGAGHDCRPAAADPHPWDVLTMRCAPETMWSTGNVSEAMPGVPTPLSVDLQRNAINAASGQALVDMGAMPPGDVHHPDRCLIGVFHGRPVGSVTTVVRAFAALPGSSVQGVTEHMFGAGARPPAGVRDTRRRYPVIAAKLPVNAMLLPRRLRAMDATTRAYRTRHLPIDDPPGRDRATEVVREGRDLFAAAIRLQGLVTFLAQGLYEQVGVLAEQAGLPAGSETMLVSGYGTLHEGALAAHLWRIAGGDSTLDEFLAEFGHHGPNEGELSSRSWREDPAPVERTLATIAGLPASESAQARVERQRAQRERLESELLAGLPGARRGPARLLLRTARTYIPLRELARSTSHRAFDTVRAHVRVLGAELAAAGLLADPDDVFHLTVDELLGPLPPDVGERVAFRRQRRAFYLRHRVPAVFTGVPDLLPAGADYADPDSAATDPMTGPAVTVRGTAVSPGLLDGVAKVVLDPENVDEPTREGEVLVCHITDPSWISLMIGAGALVTDVGGAMSHAAIIARELGIPCVVATGNATSVIRTGDRLRVDGGAGTVEVLDRGADDEGNAG